MNWTAIGRCYTTFAWALLLTASRRTEVSPWIQSRPRIYRVRAMLGCRPGDGCGSLLQVADKRRFDLFAGFVTKQFPAARRVFDIAGGMGKLNEALTARGLDVTTFDKRWKHADVKYAQRLFTLDEPCDADVVVGMHPDGATRIIVEYAAKHGVGFAIVPCCSDNGMPYKPWMRHLAELGQGLGLAVQEQTLPMLGRARVILGRPVPRVAH